MNFSEKTSAAAAALFRHYKLLIFGLLVLVEIFFLVNNWDSVYYGMTAWYIIFPVSLFLTAENAVKLWGLKKFSAKIACYVMDVMALLLFTIFSDGILISTLYMIILSDFYIVQDSLKNNIIMVGSCLGLLLISFSLSNSLRGIEMNVTGLISTMLNDLLLVLLHFFIFNFSTRLYKKNKEIAAALDELNLTNRKLQEITVLEERQRIAKDIHDTAGHSITTVIVETEAAKLVIDSDPAEAKRKVAAANLQAKHALEELRESVHLLSGKREEITLKDALLSIIHDSSDDTDIAIRYDIDEIELCDAKRRFLLNTLKEGISNGLRHGGATAFWFELKHEDGNVCFLLSDNGSGRNISDLKEGFGLTGMHARAESLGGDVWFETEPDEGFEIHLILPDDGKK